MKLWGWFRDLPLSIKLFFVLSFLALFVMLVPSPFTE
mgnify:CR=1 FL=1